MKTLFPYFVLTTVLFGVLAPAAAATPTLHQTALTQSNPDAKACHPLMTDQECGHFLARLSQMDSGPEQERFLAEHAIAMQEREAACSCNRKLMAEVLYP